MSVFAELGHADLLPDVPDDLDPAVSLDWGPGLAAEAEDVEPVNLPRVREPFVPLGISAAEHVREFFARQRAAATVRRDPGPLPEPERRAELVDLADPGIPKGAADFIKLALAAGVDVTATTARGPLPSERGVCAACKRWAKVNKDGSLSKHGTEATACPWGQAGAEDAHLADDGTCAACGAKAKVRARGAGLSKHQTPALKCESTTLAEDSPAYEQVDSILVRAVSPAGHAVARLWVNRDGWKAERTAILLRGDRPRPIGADDLEQTLRRMGQAAQRAPEPLTEPVRHEETLESPQEPRQAPRVDSGPLPADATAFVASRGGRFEYAYEAVAEVERDNCATGCAHARAAVPESPGGSCSLICTALRGGGDVLEDWRVHSDGITCLRRAPRDGAA